ncbi:MAG: diacylglycerol kinase family protein [Niastella sp.]|nr:diacylglycerol kinase family protein [Niastella sp.]
MIKFFQSFGYATKGLWHCIQREQNFKIEFLIGLITIIAAVALGVTAQEWMIICICIGMVLGAEMLNSAIEHLCNLVQPGPHPGIKIIKDIAAGAVLLCALMAAITGSIIFIPYIILLF